MPESSFAPFESARPGEPPVRGYLHIPRASSHDGLILTHSAGANATRLCSSLSQTPFARPGSPFSAAICLSANCVPTDRRRAAAPNATSKACAKPSKRSRAKFQAASSSAAIPTADAKPRCSPLPIPRSLTRCSCFPIRYIRRKRPRNYAPRISRDLRTPALFVSGTRDGFATLDELTAALKLIPARTQLLPIEAAGHELLTPRNRATLPQQVASAFTTFVAS